MIDQVDYLRGVHIDCDARSLIISEKNTQFVMIDQVDYLRDVQTNCDAR
jgi:hypothetical protein